jgi:hypothetical protein
MMPKLPGGLMSDQQCTTCGNVVPDGAAFCPECGTRTEEASPAPAEQPAAAGGAASGSADPAGPAPTSTSDPASGSDAVPGGDDPTRADVPVPDHTEALPPTTVLPAAGAAGAVSDPAAAGGPWAPNPPSQPPWSTPPSSDPPGWSAPPSADPPGWPAAPPAAAAPAAAGQWQTPASPPVAGQPGALDAGWSAQPGYNPPAAAAVAAKRPSPGAPVAGIVAFIGGALAIVSVWLTWITVDLGSVSASQTGWKSTDDAKILLGIGIVSVALSVMVLVRTAGVFRILLILAGLGCVAIGIRDLLDVGTVADEIRNAGIKLTGQSAGIGLYLCIVAGVVLIIAGVLAGSKKTS